MSVIMESSRPLEELVDQKYAKKRGIGAAKKMLDSLMWASENLLLCVERRPDGDVVVSPERAQCPPPTLAALTFLKSWAGQPDGKLAETIARLTLKLANDQKRGSQKVDGRRRVRGGGEEDGVFTAEERRRVDAINARIAEAKAAREARELAAKEQG